MELSEARGRLVAIGGGDIREGDAPLLKEFIKLAKGPKARIVLMTVATDEPAAAAAEYKTAFNKLGVDDVKAVDVSSRADALKPEALEAVENATGLFFTTASPSSSRTTPLRKRRAKRTRAKVIPVKPSNPQPGSQRRRARGSR